MLRCWIGLEQYESGLVVVDSLRNAMLSTFPPLNKGGQGGISSVLSIAMQERLSSLTIDGGRLAGRMGKREEAFRRWEEFYSLPHPSSNAFFRLMSAMIDCRYPDGLQDMVTKGRKVTGDPTLLAASLASYYSQRGQSDKAIEELLGLMEAQPVQSDAIQRQILAMPEDNQAKDQVEATLKAALKRDAIRLPVTQILAQFYFRNRQWDKAYEQALAADKLGGATGEAMLGFAETLLTESQSRLALQVLDDLAKFHPQISNSPRSLLARAKALEAERAYHLADSVFSRLTSSRTLRTAQEQEALQLHARLKLERLRQPAAARQLLTEGVKNNSRLRSMGQITLLIGDTYLAERNLEQARKTYLDAAQGIFPNTTEIKAKALVCAAQVDLCLGQVSQALSRLNEASASNPEGMLANDALDLVRLLGSAQGDTVTIAALACADLELRLGETARAEEQYTAIAQQTKVPELAEQALVSLAKLYRSSARPEPALKTLNEALTRFPKSLRAPEFIFVIGQIHEKDLGDPQGAIKEYEKILIDYPNSLPAQEARRRIRELESVKTS
jgi:lipopolysaccharide biosynthesis regulator YciM